jgi:acetyl-CoA acetyltransferase
MSLRGRTAIVGIGEIPTKRTYPGRSTVSLMTEAATLALQDARITKAEIDGLISNAEAANPLTLAEYMGLQPAFVEGVTSHGASGAQSIVIAASAINAGLCSTVLCVLGGNRAPDPGVPTPNRSVGSEWEGPYGPGVATTARYALLKQRHMHEYGSKDAQFAQMAVNQRFNALTNPNAVFHGQPLTLEDVLNSRYASEPIHLLETVMPCGGAAAAIVTSAERATSYPNRPVYILGAGGAASNHDVLWQDPKGFTTTPVALTAKRAFAMAGYGPKDVQLAQFYDCYTVLEAACLEDAGFCNKGEIGDFFESTDTTYKGTFPVNTDGGQLSGGQPGGNAGGFRHVVEAARQIMGKAGERQVVANDLACVNG